MSLKARTNYLPYLLLTPTLLFFAIFIVYPLGVLINLSFYQRYAGTTGVFIGLKNFQALLQDTGFMQAISNTAIYVAGAVSIRLLFAFGLALILNQKIKGRSFFRGLMLLPWLTPMVPAVLTWRWILSRDYGILNHLLIDLNLLSSPINFLGDPILAKVTVIVFNVWKYFPFYTVVFLAGLQAIPVDIYEAAEIDGASSWLKLRHITMPFMRNLFAVLCALSAVWTMGEFVSVWLLTRGGPSFATHTFATLGFEQAFLNYNIGLAAAMFVIVLPVTVGLTILTTQFLVKES